MVKIPPVTYRQHRTKRYLPLKKGKSEKSPCKVLAIFRKKFIIEYRWYEDKGETSHFVQSAHRYISITGGLLRLLF
jgi:hypothetical protein